MPVCDEYEKFTDTHFSAHIISAFNVLFFKTKLMH